MHKQQNGRFDNCLSIRFSRSCSPQPARSLDRTMQNDLTLLRSTSLFSGLSQEDLAGLLARMGAVRRSYSRGVVLVQAGSPSHNVGIILSARNPACAPAAPAFRLQNLTKTVHLIKADS